MFLIFIVTQFSGHLLNIQTVRREIKVPSENSKNCFDIRKKTLLLETKIYKNQDWISQLSLNIRLIEKPKLRSCF